MYSRKLLNRALENKNKSQEARSYYKIAEFQRKLKVKDSAFYYYKKSKELYLQENDSIQVARCLLNIAIIESDFGDYANSDISGINSLKYLNGRRKKTIISSYNTLAINSKRQFLFEEAIYNYNRALSYKPSEKNVVIIKKNIANVYKEQGNYLKSILTLDGLLQDSIKSTKTRIRIIDNLAHIKWLQNPKANVLKDLLLANSNKQRFKDNYGLIASYSHLSEFFNNKNRSKSLFYANEMYKVSKKERSPNDIIESIDKIVALQTPHKAMKFYKESIHLRDSLQVADTKRQYKFAKIKYNYEEEEKLKLKFKTLAAENKLIAEQESSQKKNILFTGVVLTTGLIFLIYRRKQQHKKRILLESYKTETRISKKLHDELGNDMYNVLTKVQNTNYKREEIVNDLDKIYLQTRAISHQNDSVETGDKFENYFRELISSYNSDDCKIILNNLSSLDLNNLKNNKQIVIYRVFNELFVNMKKHSKANLVVISCKKENNFSQITYSDNGVGFKDNSIVFKNGLKNMETRIKMIKGTVNFESKPKKGLKVTFNFKN
ncbi:MULTISPECIES: tetratricopeptide repeat-containing sensor histidine kinase [Tenacibaculum]|uniref:tetratricopeptide repeat-containing sensor histidine kinase n=1 Tax=Tenacibaculum TaxID=104267 RepID=UPI001F0A0B60|nr:MULTISPECIES: ATP-binding protein [Tenacibaculum]MCH3883262.1 hypothetical protein [Tenacibaculum aquimarinum]MDO6600382.1 hypothetical protein [Tenacibaculum sp. 1_MG-2023]